MFMLNSEQAREVTEKFQQRKVPLFVSHFNRCMPQIQYVKRMLNENTIGEIKSIEMNVGRQYNKNALENKSWMKDTSLSGGGWFTDLGPHYIDILIYLFGNLKVIESTVENTMEEYKHLEDYVDLRFNTEKEIKGHANFNFNDKEWNDRVIIKGEKGTLEFKVLGRDKPVIFTLKDGEPHIQEFKNEELLQSYMIEKIIEIMNDYKCKKISYEETERKALEMGLCTGKEAVKSSIIITDVIKQFNRQIKFQSYNVSPVPLFQKEQQPQTYIKSEYER